MEDFQGYGEEGKKNQDVRLGLRKKCRCKLCEHEFYVEKLPGVISFNSWGYPVIYPGPATLYKPERICIFCSQFFSHLVSEDEIKKELERKTRVRKKKKRKKY